MKCKLVNGYIDRDVIVNVMACGLHLHTLHKNLSTFPDETQHHIKICKGVNNE